MTSALVSAASVAPLDVRPLRYPPLVARLGSSDRTDLPDRAFAYVDSRGRRRLPIHDAAHVRNALARFNQVSFEDDAARERARTRLLNAAKRQGIVPVGFIRSQLDSERAFAERRAREPASLPTGFLTMLMTDIEGSTGLVEQLGERYRELIGEVRAVLRETAVAFSGLAVETRADEFFAVFESPGGALDAAVAMQRALRGSAWVDGVAVNVRIGIHSGYPTLDEVNYIGLAIHTTARVCAAAHGGQVIVSGDTKEASQGQRPAGLRFVSLGEHRLRGIRTAVPLFQAAAKGLPFRFPPPRTIAR
jgi:class 3 adenylate cyclase